MGEPALVAKNIDGTVQVAANGYGSIDDSCVYAVIREQVIVEACVLEKIHKKINPNWEVAAAVILIMYKQSDQGYREVLSNLRKTSLEYFNLVEAIQKVLEENGEYEDCKPILAEL